MATLEDLQLFEFTGKDSEEFEQFISAVLKHAFAQGKQRDDAWIAKFAATCLTEDALRWWTGLDKKTQKSWKLLRRAMALEYKSLFRGESGQEAEKFVQMVHRRAREAGKQGDNKWIMEFVSSCLAGDALTWYSSLDGRVRAEWVLFQKATFAQYPREDGLDSPSSTFSIIPTPAAAAPIPCPPYGTKRGRIRVFFTDSGFVKYYISKEVTINGFFCLTKSLDDALEVEHDGTPKDLKPLFIPQNQVQGFDSVGIVWDDMLLKDSSNFAALIPVDSKTNERPERSNFFNGKVLTNIWRFTPGRCQFSDPRISAVFQNVNLFATSAGDGATVLFHTTLPKQNNVSLVFERI